MAKRLRIEINRMTVKIFSVLPTLVLGRRGPMLVIQCGWGKWIWETHIIRLAKSKMIEWRCDACGEAENCDIHCIVTSEFKPKWCPSAGDETEFYQILEADNGKE